MSEAKSCRQQVENRQSLLMSTGKCFAWLNARLRHFRRVNVRFWKRSQLDTWCVLGQEGQRWAHQSKPLCFHSVWFFPPLLSWGDGCWKTVWQQLRYFCTQGDYTNSDRHRVKVALLVTFNPLFPVSWGILSHIWRWFVIIYMLQWP